MGTVTHPHREAGKRGVMGNVGRILTLRVRITDHDKSKCIWDNHMKGVHDSPMGFHIDTIADGDTFEERDDLEEKLHQYERRYGFLEYPTEGKGE